MILIILKKKNLLEFIVDSCRKYDDLETNIFVIRVNNPPHCKPYFYELEDGTYSWYSEEYAYPLFKKIINSGSHFMVQLIQINGSNKDETLIHRWFNDK